MNSGSDLNLLYPKLKECHQMLGDSKLILEDAKTQGQLVLPSEYKEMIDLFDGRMSVKDIISELYNLKGSVSFNSLITTIHLLQGANLLEEMDEELEKVKVEKGPHEQKSSVLIRPLLEVVLKNKVSLKIKSDTLFFAIMALVFSGIIAACFLMPETAFWKFHFNSFMKGTDGFQSSLLKLFAIVSALLTIKVIFKGILLLFGAGGFYRLSLRLNLFSLSFGLNENSIYSSGKIKLIIYSICCASLYLFIATAFAFVFPASPLVNDVKILALIFTLIELDPYRQSEMTKMFHFLYAEDQLKSLTPYLKNCSLSFTSKGQKFMDELRFMIYSILAMAWAVGFTLFSIDLIMNNLTGILLALQVESLVGQISAAVILFLLLFIFGYLFIDLLHTIFKNVVFPFMVPLAKLSSSSRKCKSKDFDNEHVKELIKQNMFFRDIHESTLDYIVENAEVKTLKKNKSLIIQGTMGREVYLLLKGKVDINVRARTGRIKSIVSLGPNTVIGEIAILKQTERTANVVAEEDIVFLEIKEVVFKKIFAQDDMQSDYQKMVARIEISQFVSSAGIFKDFPSEIMNIFVEAGDLINFPANGEIVTQGEEDKTFYMLIKGAVEVIKDGEVLTELGQGDFFGEIALIANTPRTATVKTKEETLLLYIEDKDFWKILSTNIELAMYLESVGRHRMLDDRS